ncbi:MAG: hypothetical protein GQ580_06485 [Candidatus Thorarchaeota archaeon]|nr:hypothetical protein [Candidatus Thorarchaeota archaeon]
MSFEDDVSEHITSMPPHIRACVTLFGSRESTAHDRAYTLEQDDLVWVYVFFEMFAVVVSTTPDEDIPPLRKRMFSLGKAFAKSYGHIIASWSGDMGDIEGVDTLVEQYMRLNLDLGSDILSKIESLVNTILENYAVAYAGVFDAGGTLLSGDIPDSHIQRIQDEISVAGIDSGVELMPHALEIQGHSVQMLRVSSLSIAVAAYRDESRMAATKAVSEIAQALHEAMN